MPAPIDAAEAPLIVHLVHQLHVGGLENGLVNLINHMPPGRYRHAIVCLKDYSNFHLRIQQPGVDIICLNKREGKDWGHYFRLYQALRRLRPLLVHSRNLTTMEGQLVAATAGVRLRVHGEHGRDIGDLHGRNRKYRLLRRLLRPLVNHFIAVSQDLEQWLIDAIGAAPEQVTHIGNGVDSLLFHPRLGPPAAIGPDGFMCAGAFVIGSVGRMAEVKNFPALVRAFLLLLDREPLARQRMRLVIVGDGPSREPCQALLRDAGAAHLAWLPGARDDIPQMMRAFSIFVLPSLAEGSSNTILEAMASGLPVVAAAVGGNPYLVRNGESGLLVPSGTPALLAAAIAHYHRHPELVRCHGRQGRRQVLASHSLTAMAHAYMAVYDRLAAAPQP